MKITVPVFVDGTSFPRKAPFEGRAWVEFSDDADDHKFKVAFETKDVKLVRDALQEEEESGETPEAGYPNLWRLTLSNDAPQEVLGTNDGIPNLRPHTIPGFWQVWSGGICIALLSPEDVKPLLEAKP
jgi:hypothetical protein